MPAIVTPDNAQRMAAMVLAERKKRADVEELKNSAARSLRSFVEQAWHVIEPGTPFVGGWNLDAICEHLEAVSSGQIRNLCVNVPPRSCKSILISICWPAWEWISHPELRWLCSSYSSKLSLEHSMKCRRVLNSKWYQTNWADKFQLIGDQNTKENYENNKTGQRIATSISGVGVGKGGDRIIADDPNNTEEMESDTLRQGVLDWWDQTMSTRGNNPKTVARVIVQQRLHEDDLTGHVLKQGGYTHLFLPMRFEEKRKCRTVIGGKVWEDPREKHGELLWPDRFGEKEIVELETRLGSYMSAGQLQQNPAPTGGGILKSFWWRYWQPAGAKMDPIPVQMPDGTTKMVNAIELPSKFDLVLSSWDMAFKDLVTSDYVVGIVLAARGANRFILDLDRGHYDLPKTLLAVRKMSAKHRDAYIKLVEDKANGPAVIQSLHATLGGFVAVNPIGGKIARAAAESPAVESGNWYLPHPLLADWVDGFIQEAAAFPKAAHDDQCFVAGTKVATIFGDRNIEDIRIGDRLITPFGIREVTACGPTGARDVVNRMGLTGTPEHPIFVHRQGFNSLDTLTQGAEVDILSLCSQIRWMLLNSLRLTGSSTEGWEGSAAITLASRLLMPGVRAPRACMSRFGSLFMAGRFLGAFKFIIGILTSSITILAIWNCYRLANIAGCIRSLTCKSKFVTLKELGHLRLLGMPLKWVENGIVKMRNGLGKTKSQLNALVNGVVKSLQVFIRPCIAGTSAGIDTADLSGFMMSNLIALSVERDSKPSRPSTQAELGPLAEYSVRKNSTHLIQKVYNLSVAGESVYYANRILVHNCDAWSQGAARLKHVTPLDDEDTEFALSIQDRKLGGWSA